MVLKKDDNIAIVGCSNAQYESNKIYIEELTKTINELGLVPVYSDFIFEKYSVFSGTGKERAEALMNFYKDENIKAIFDISGGDIANEVLNYIDFDVIKKNPKPFFGYSDLTTIINAIYAKTEEVSYLYQIRNLIYKNRQEQLDLFKTSILGDKEDLFDIEYKFLVGEKMEGVVIGGNIRCFLKLAGTPFMPNFDNKILLLESLGGDAGVMTTLLSQLKQIGAFEKINGILLGTFTNMEKNDIRPTIEELVISIVNDKNIPIIKTCEIGHGNDSKAIRIGSYKVFINK